LNSHREEKEKISELKSLMGTAALPAGTLALGAEGIKNAISTFDQAKKADRENEKLPPMKDGKAPPVAAPVFGTIMSAGGPNPASIAGKKIPNISTPGGGSPVGSPNGSPTK
jgi:serine/threonine-protein phosphatase 2B catalytic subunit